MRPEIQYHDETSELKVASSENIGVLGTSKTVPQFQIWLFPPDEDIISKKILDTGVYEAEETLFLTQVASSGSPGGWAVDIGANVGFHSLHMASLGMNVISFEPSPDTARLLKQSVVSNGFNLGRPAVHIVEAAASEETGTGRLVRHPDSPGMTILQKAGDSQSLPFGVANLVADNIPLIRPESVLSKHINAKQRENLKLLKIDAEGHELHSFRGVDLGKFPFQFVTFEFFPELLWKAGQTDPVDLLLYINSFNYACCTSPTALARNENIMSTPEQLQSWYESIAKPAYKASVGYHVNIYCKKAS